jgi:Fe(3+) dicitrate transport protein
MLLGATLAMPASLHAQRQRADTVPRPAQLPTVTVRSGPSLVPVGALPDVRGAEVFAGKKTEVIRLDSLTVNTAGDVTRQVLGRVPGANISETQNSGFPSNGLGFRGLNPVQSVEMNVRQDGVNIVADLYGYPETYYTPPAEALERVELVRGSSSLQFGPQFGGVVDYVLRDGAPDTPPTFAFKQTAASYDGYTSYASVDGGRGQWTYFGYAQYRFLRGWRPNSDVDQLSAAFRARYRVGTRVSFGLEYSLLRNRLHMPGGLDNTAFNADSRQSFRARNWLASPWNVLAATMAASLSPHTTLTSALSYMFSQRYLVWRDQTGGAAAVDTMDPATAAFTPRQVDRENFDNLTEELRLSTNYSAFGVPQTLATGVRAFVGTLHRQEGGTGTTGSDFDMSLTAPYTTDVKFGTGNVALFAENVIGVGRRLSITPGVRFEYLHSTARGYTDTTVTPQAHDRSFLLAGIGADLRTGASTDLYANITQAYRPIEYSYLTPFASVARIDPHLEDPTGYNADLGWRGTLGSAVSFDISLFYLNYRNRIGLVSGIDSSGVTYQEWENVATSTHKGAETYVSLRPLALLGAAPRWGALDVWDALGYTDAHYANGPFAGNAVEYAPRVINRLGVTYSLGRMTNAVEWSATSRQFTDANNTVASYDANVGVVPAYRLLDWSATWRFGPRTRIGVGINNIAAIRYFTMRTTEYPGPGIIPGIGRSMYLTLDVDR